MDIGRVEEQESGYSPEVSIREIGSGFISKMMGE
jgi:hypothetical protein